jgi:hypothetical protein
VLAAEVRPGEPELLAEEVRKRHARLGGAAHRGAVDAEVDAPSMAHAAIVTPNLAAINTCITGRFRAGSCFEAD